MSRFSVAIKDQKFVNLINDTLGDPDTAKRFVAEVSTAVAMNPKLQDCDTGSILSAGLMAQTLNLPMSNSLGFAYLIPYGNKCQFQMGWKGLLQLAQRSGVFLSVGTKVVREGEYKGRDKITGEDIVEFEEYEDLRKPVIGYFAYFTLLNGFRQTKFMTKEAVEKHMKRYSKSYSSGPWKDDFDLMAQKTVLKAVLKYAPMDTNLARAMQADQAVIKEDGTFDYVDNPENDKERKTNVAVNVIPEGETIDDDDKPF